MGFINRVNKEKKEEDKDEEIETHYNKGNST